MDLKNIRKRFSGFHILVLAVILLITVVWSIPYFCGEIHKAAEVKVGNDDNKKPRQTTVAKDHSDAVELPPANKAAGDAKVDCDDMPLTMLSEERCGYSEKEIMFLDGPFRTKLNGQKLKLDPYSPNEDMGDFTDAKITLLSAGKMLVGAGNKIYLLDDKKRVVWKLDVVNIDYAVVESTGMVYITAVDNTMLIVGLASGKELYSNTRNGSMAYGQVKPFGNDLCLILDNNSGYRMMKSRRELQAPDSWVPDGITAWRGTKELWHKDFPPDATLMVKGNRIYAVTKTKANIYVREISAPKI
jgi:hypothetical protein